MLYIVGLGNKGDEYKFNRHNVGWLFLDFICRDCSFRAGKGEYAFAQHEFGYLFKPLTYMNLSGIAVKQIVEDFKVPLDKLIVIYDDADLPLGRVRFRLKGGAGTHNGMKSIIYYLGTEEFPRLRIGIGKPQNVPLRVWVLSNFTKEEMDVLYRIFPLMEEGLKLYAKGEVNSALNLMNSIKEVSL